MHNQRLPIYFLLLCVGIFISPLQSCLAGESAKSAAPSDYKVLAGEWQRADGSYSITLTEVQNTGEVTAAYFNPRPIHVEEAALSTWKGLIKLFVKLQDKGYEGSTYTLYYYAEKDALAGFYYQATLDRTYKVIFTRKNN